MQFEPSLLQISLYLLLQEYLQDTGFLEREVNRLTFQKLRQLLPSYHLFVPSIVIYRIDFTVFQYNPGISDAGFLNILSMDWKRDNLKGFLQFVGPTITKLLFLLWPLIRSFLITSVKTMGWIVFFLSTSLAPWSHRLVYPETNFFS